MKTKKLKPSETFGKIAVLVKTRGSNWINKVMEPQILGEVPAIDNNGFVTMTNITFHVEEMKDVVYCDTIAEAEKLLKSLINQSLVHVNKYAMIKARSNYEKNTTEIKAKYQRSSTEIIKYFELTGNVLIDDPRLKECEKYWNDFYKKQSEL